MGTRTTAGALSFGADAIRPLPVSAARKADDLTRAEQAKVAAMQPQTRQWADVLTLPQLELLDLMARDYAAEGLAAFPIRIADIARRLGDITTADAQRRLDALLDKGAVARQARLMQAPVYRPVARTAESAVRITVTSKADQGKATIAAAAPHASFGLRHRRG
jgi:hypothetical protein